MPVACQQIILISAAMIRPQLCSVAAAREHSIILRAHFEAAPMQNLLMCHVGCRYGTYKKVQAMPGGERLVAFTRVLHRTVPDVLMQEVSTRRAYLRTPNSSQHTLPRL